MEYKNAKAQFVEELKNRIFNWVVRVSNYCEKLPASSTVRVINYQLIKSSTSTGANHRAASRARSQNEFFSKMSIAVEEVDESLYWLQLIKAKNYNINPKELDWLIKEADEFTRILSVARFKAGQKK